MRFIDVNKLICSLEQFSESCGSDMLQVVIKQVIYLIDILAEEVK